MCVMFESKLFEEEYSILVRQFLFKIVFVVSFSLVAWYKRIYK